MSARFHALLTPALVLFLGAGCSTVERYGAPIAERAPSTPAATAHASGQPGSAQREVVPASNLFSDPARYDGRDLIVEGRVAEVCPVKGCWMVVREGDASLRITFKDYAFFVPKDCAGDMVRADGVFAVVDVSVEDARHYLEDAGRHAEAQAITSPVRSLTFVASGVELTRE